MAMKEYNFAYINRSFAIKLTILSFVITPIIFFSCAIITSNPDTQSSCVLLAIILPFVLFFSFVKKSVVSGKAVIEDNSLFLDTILFKGKIPYNEILSYQTVTLFGAELRLNLRNGNKYFIYAPNKYYCDCQPLASFCYDLDNKLNAFKKYNESTITKKKSIFEKNWMYLLMVGLSVFVPISIVYASYLEKYRAIGFLLGGFALIIPYWIFYFNNKKN